MSDKNRDKKISIILAETPFHSDKVEQCIKIAEAALGKKHSVSLFLFMDGVYNLILSQDGEPFKIESVSSRLQRLIADGAEIYCCRLCKTLRGITDDMISSSVQVTGISELNDLISYSDAVISFTG